MKRGSVDHSPRGANDGLEGINAVYLVREGGDWRQWVHRLEHRRNRERPDLSGVAALLACAHPTPTYPDQCFTPEGLKVLAPESRYEPQQEGAALQSLLVNIMLEKS